MQMENKLLQQSIGSMRHSGICVIVAVRWLINLNVSWSS